MAMHSLSRNIGGHGAIAVPMVIVELDGDSIKYRGVTGSKRLDKMVRELGKEEENFVTARTTIVENNRCEKGYIRDHPTSPVLIDPDMEVEDGAPLESETLTLAR